MVRKSLKTQFCKTLKCLRNQTHLEVSVHQTRFEVLEDLHPSKPSQKRETTTQTGLQAEEGHINWIRQRLLEWGGEDWKGPQGRVGLETRRESVWRSLTFCRYLLQSDCGGTGGLGDVSHQFLWTEEWVWGSGSCPLLFCTGHSSRTGRCVWTLPSPHRCCFCLISQQDCSVTGDQTDWSRSSPIASPHWSVSVQARASVDRDWSKMSVWSPLAPDWWVVQWHQQWAWLNVHLVL